MQSPYLLAGLIVLAVWIGFLTVTLRRMQNKYSLFTKGASRKTLEEVLTNIIKDQDLGKKEIAHLAKRCDIIEKDALSYIQKIGLLRFNPFKDTGGDQSFILSLIDAEESGIVITALYSRSGTRWYAKRVLRGRGMEHELSEDEKKALKIAKEIK
jgi:hypothetical protein